MSADISVGAESPTRTGEPTFTRRWLTPISASALLLVLTTVVLLFLEARLKQDHLIFIYFVPTALIAIRYGSLSAMGVAIASAFAAAFLLYPPRFSLMIDNPLDLLELVLFSLLALLASQVVSGFANDEGVARRRLRPRNQPFSARWPLMASRWNRIRPGGG
jgi:K+-sensing histidine kinase KdpD